MTGNRIILLDLGRVLIDFDHQIAVRRIKEHCSLDEQGIYNLFFDSDITDRFEKGIISPINFYQEVRNMLKAEISYDKFVPIWNEIFSAHPGMLEVLESLKDHHALYLVSNINKLHFEYLQKEFRDYFKYFSYIFLSYELGLRKPDSRIYKFIIDYLKTKPENIIYTDDRIELIGTAIELGMDAFLFESTDLFKEELIKRGIKLDTVLNKKE
ncbi:MAG: HAD family phosphatase [Candidatus Omnitrophota bacterium]